jgi:hypothetical protein
VYYNSDLIMNLNVKKVKLTVEEAMKAHTGSRTLSLTSVLYGGWSS